MARVNNSYYSILGILGFGPMSGYGIKTWVDEGVSYFQDIDYKQIYPTLKRLVEDGCATYKLERNGNRPESKVYAITEKGLEELRKWLNKPITSGKKGNNELKLKLFFGYHIPVEKHLEHINKHKSDTIRSLEAIKQIKECLQKEAVKDASWYYRMTTIMNGEMGLGATIEWCDKAIEYLNTYLVQDI